MQYYLYIQTYIVIAGAYEELSRLHRHTHVEKITQSSITIHTLIYPIIDTVNGSMIWIAG